MRQHLDATLHRTLLRRTLGRSSGDSSAAGGRASPRLLRRFLPAAEAGARWSWEEVAGELLVGRKHVVSSSAGS